MANLQIFKVNALPAEAMLVANAIYYVKNGTKFDVYVTDSTAKAVPQNSVTAAEVDTAVAAAIANINKSLIVADIAARDALASSLTANTFVFVQDATGDTTVSSGAALYLFDNDTDTFIKVAEYESMDVVLDWANIQNKPTSTAAEIDAAVADSHTHANKAVLDKIGEDESGTPTYNGVTLVSQWGATEW